MSEPRSPMRWTESLVACVLCAALAICAPALKKQHDRAKRALDAARAGVTRRPSLGFPSLGGIELSGKIMGPAFDAAVTRTLVCRLRMSSLTEDIAELDDVASALDKNVTISLVAYCDGPACGQALRSQHANLPFPVLTHGEVVSSQALANADDRGQCILVGKGFSSAKMVNWRKPGIRSEDVLREIAK